MTTKVILKKEMRQKIIKYVVDNGQITNRECRTLLNLEYDQVIRVFKIMVNDGDLVRIGKTASTRYILPSSSDNHINT